MDVQERGTKDLATHGAYEATSRHARELASWHATSQSADRELLHEKETLDARANDMVRNEGYARSAVHIHRDSIVGGEYRLNAQPDYETLGADEGWAEEFQKVVESKFNLWAESPDCWPDAAREHTLTGLVRLAVGLHVFTGESLATAEWLRTEPGRRPFNTAIQMIDVARLSNPHGVPDTARLRGGIERDRYGAPLAYHIRLAHPNDVALEDLSAYQWKRVPIRKPWGRLQVLHMFEAFRPDQTRGVADMVSVLKEMRMTKKFRDVVLQNAVVNASFAAAIESEVPAETLWSQLGGAVQEDNPLAKYLEQLAAYMGGARGLHIDGVKIPALFPGTKLNLKPMGTPGGVGTEFEESLHRHIARLLGLSYEEFSGDYTKTNYSSARASKNDTFRYMQSKKKMVADKKANHIYSLWLEEAVNRGEVPMPRGKTAADFYVGLNKEAFCRAEWIGASRGQIDELKETEAAVMRVEKGLSTYEKELSRLGEDFRRVFKQRQREKKMMKEMGIEIVSDAVVTAKMKTEAGGKPERNEEREQE